MRVGRHLKFDCKSDYAFIRIIYVRYVGCSLNQTGCNFQWNAIRALWANTTNLCNFVNFIYVFLMQFQSKMKKKNVNFQFNWHFGWDGNYVILTNTFIYILSNAQDEIENILFCFGFFFIFKFISEQMKWIYLVTLNSNALF